VDKRGPIADILIGSPKDPVSFVGCKLPASVWTKNNKKLATKN